MSRRLPIVSSVPAVATMPSVQAPQKSPDIAKPSFDRKSHSCCRWPKHSLHISTEVTCSRLNAVLAEPLGAETINAKVLLCSVKAALSWRWHTKAFCSRHDLTVSPTQVSSSTHRPSEHGSGRRLLLWNAHKPRCNEQIDA